MFYGKMSIPIIVGIIGYYSYLHLTNSSRLNFSDIVDSGQAVKIYSLHSNSKFQLTQNALCD